MSTLKKPYFDKMISQVSTDFVSMIMIGERIIDGMKSETFKDIEVLQTMVEKESGKCQKSMVKNGSKKRR